jgi:hypothetical protein
MNEGSANTPTSRSNERLTEVPAAANPALLASLAKLVRGLSALFWGLPAALVVAVQIGKGDFFPRVVGSLPLVIAAAMLFYGTHLLRSFQPQERIWQTALDRARVIALVNIGLSPFVYYWSRISGNSFFTMMVQALCVSGLIYLYLLNSVLARLAAMLPDEALRGETRIFTRINQVIVLVILGALPLYFIALNSSRLPRFIVEWLVIIQESNTVFEFAALLVFVLLPVAMTMALLWKTKEVILSGVFASVGQDGSRMP